MGVRGHSVVRTALASVEEGAWEPSATGRWGDMGREIIVFSNADSTDCPEKKKGVFQMRSVQIVVQIVVSKKR
jgi:hypothetical protein